MFFGPQPSLLEGLCVQEILNPTVFPGDTTRKADFHRPKYPETEVQEDFK